MRMTSSTSPSMVKNVSDSNQSSNASSESFTNNGVFIAASAGLSIVVPITVVLIVQFWRAKKLEREGNRQPQHATSPRRDPYDQPPSYEQVFGPAHDIPVAVPPSYSSIQYLIQHEESLPRRENTTHVDTANRLVNIFRDQTPPAVSGTDSSCCHDNLTGSLCLPVSITGLDSHLLDSVSGTRIAVGPSSSSISLDGSTDGSFSTQKEETVSQSETSVLESKTDLIISTHFSSPQLAPLATLSTQVPSQMTLSTLMPSQMTSLTQMPSQMTSLTQMPSQMTLSTQMPSQMTPSTQMLSHPSQELSTQILAPIQPLPDSMGQRQTSNSSTVPPAVTHTRHGPAAPSTLPQLYSDNFIEAPPPSYDDVLKIMDLAILSSSQHKVTV